MKNDKLNNGAIEAFCERKCVKYNSAKKTTFTATIWRILNPNISEIYN